jgi:hypothetical protein
MPGRPTTCLFNPIHSSLLQTISEELLQIITFLFNSSLTTGCVPSDNKMARVVNLLEKLTLDPSDIRNNRPVSLIMLKKCTLEFAVSD